MYLLRAGFKFKLMLGFFLFGNGLVAQSDFAEKRQLVNMRMIGHQMLLDVGDSVSRVHTHYLDSNRYQIQFDSNFEFKPAALVGIIDSVLSLDGADESYFVEVEDCDTKEIVYSYSANPKEYKSIVPCGGREQPEACYSIYVSVLDPAIFEALKIDEESENLNHSETRSSGLDFKLTTTIGILLILLAVYLIVKRNQKEKLSNANLIPIGAYQFDSRNMRLLLNDQDIELTSKEADLLELLFASVNNTVERETILNAVWGDEGDYVGRTLDVFISKLRKKLGEDPKIKIANIRGVGYRLVLND